MNSFVTPNSKVNRSVLGVSTHRVKTSLPIIHSVRTCRMGRLVTYYSVKAVVRRLLKRYSACRDGIGDEPFLIIHCYVSEALHRLYGTIHGHT